MSEWFNHRFSQASWAGGNMHLLGIGPLLALTGVLTGALAVFFCRVTGHGAALAAPWREWFLWVGVIWGLPGIYFWLASIIALKRAVKSRRLAREGVYGLSRNPMYTGIIIFIIPGLTLILNNMLLLAASATMLLVFKLRIGREERLLSREFGAEYERYRARVPQLLLFKPRLGQPGI